MSHSSRPGERKTAQACLAPDVETTIIACIRQARGAEICGYLLEDEHGTQSFLALENRLASRDGVFVSALDVDRAKRIIAATHRRILAWVHSHDVGISLSPVDRMGVAESNTTVSDFGPSLAKGAESQARSEEGGCWWQATDERQSL